jgi:Heavy metal binding domain
MDEVHGIEEHPMNQRLAARRVYLCPMHSEVQQADPGKCPKCGMALVVEGSRFGVLQHMIKSPLHLVIMVLVMVLVMAATMMLMR